MFREWKMAQGRRKVFHHLFWFTLLGCVASAGLMWAWNVIAVDLFDASQAHFRHGIASVAALYLAACVVRFAARLA